MVDVWDSVTHLLDSHFSGNAPQTMNGKPLERFLPLDEARTRVTFVDGGSAPLFETPSAAVYLVRVAALEYDGPKRTQTHRKEAICVITRDGETTHVEWAGAPWPTFTLHGHTIEETADIARRISERRLGSTFPNLVVFDGDLEPRHPLESDAMASSIGPSCGLAKTTTMRTDQGKSAAGVLHAQGPAEQWVFPLDDANAFVKLHKLSLRSYRIQTNNILVTDAAAALCATNDPSFVGYPYGLVEADMLARVTVAEQRALAELLRTRLRDRWRGHTGALDAHAVLDAIAGNSPVR